MFVRPAPGLTILRPDTRTALPPEGADVPDQAWCLRGIRSGDLLAGAGGGTPTPTPTPTPSPTPTPTPTPSPTPTPTPTGTPLVIGTTAGTVAAGNDPRIVGAVQASSLAAVATSGAYADLTGKPTIPAAPGIATTTTPGLFKPGVGFVWNSTTQAWDLDSAPPLAWPGGPLLTTDQVLVVRGTGGSALTYLAPETALPGAGGTAPAETLTLATPSAQVAGTAFALSGTYTNGPPTALDWSLDGTTWTAAASPTIGSGSYSFGGVTVPAANSAQTVRVRDHNVTGVTATSGAFVVSAAAAQQSGTGAANSVTPGAGDPYTYSVQYIAPNGSGAVLDSGSISLSATASIYAGVKVATGSGASSTGPTLIDIYFAKSATNSSVGQLAKHSIYNSDYSGQTIDFTGAAAGDTLYLWIKATDQAAPVQVGRGIPVVP